MWMEQQLSKQPHLFTRLMLWLALGSAALLFMPALIIDNLQLSPFLNQYAHFVGMGFIASSVFLGLQLMLHLVQKLKQHFTDQRIQKDMQERIRLMVTGERALVREFFLQRKTSLWLPQNEPEVKSLMSSGILIPMDHNATLRNSDGNGVEIELIISHFARPYLTRQILKLPQGKPTQEDIDYLRGARPLYMPSLSLVANKSAA